MFSGRNSAPKGPRRPFFPPTSGLGTSFSCYTASTGPCDLQSVSHSSLTPPEAVRAGQRVTWRSEGGPQRSEAAAINPALPLGCRGCGCHSKLDGKHTAIFSLQGGKPRLSKAGSYQQNRRHVCSFVRFPITPYPSGS